MAPYTRAKYIAGLIKSGWTVEALAAKLHTTEFWIWTNIRLSTVDPEAGYYIDLWQLDAEKCWTIGHCSDKSKHLMYVHRHRMTTPEQCRKDVWAYLNETGLITSPLPWKEYA
jgi:hypothetical protein